MHSGAWCCAGGVVGSTCAPAAVLLGAAAGLVSFMGGADLAYQLISDPHAHLTGTVLSALAGAGAAVRAYRWGLTQMGSAGPAEKVKADVESLSEMPHGKGEDWHVLNDNGRCAAAVRTHLPCTLYV